jgi:tetratricopeptide (TPR) repeat protein
MKSRQNMIATVLITLSIFPLASKLSFAQQVRTDQQIGYYQQMLKRNPRNATALLGLGDALIRKARETGDPSYFNRAEEALKKSLDITPKNFRAARALAYVFYSRHEFGPAAAQARRAVEMNPEDGDSYGILGDALLEVGQYAEAEAAYDYMIELEQSLYSYSRRAGLKSMGGDTTGAIADLERAVALGKATQQPSESIAWAEWQLGMEYFAVGDLSKSQDYFQQSLDSYPNYYRALASLAQLRFAQEQYGDAIKLYEKAIAILPMPDYIAALGDIYAKSGRRKEAQRQFELVEYIGRLNEINKVLYNRELAYFYADHDIKPREGLELALRELEYRRDIYAYDVVAWNLYRNGKFEEARTAIDQALRLGTQDAKLFFHAGMIYSSLGEKTKAKEFLSGALGINPYFHPIFAETAAENLARMERETDHAEMEAERQGG